MSIHQNSKDFINDTIIRDIKDAVDKLIYNKVIEAWNFKTLP